MSLPISVSFDLKQLEVISKVWRIRGFTSRSDYIRHCVEEDLESSNNPKDFIKDFKGIEKMTDAMTRQRFRGRVLYGFDKYDKRVAKIEDEVKNKHKTREQADREIAEAKEDYGIVEKETERLLNRQEPKKRLNGHEQKPKRYRSKEEWDSEKANIKWKKRTEKARELRDWMTEHNEFCKDKCKSRLFNDDCARECDLIGKEYDTEDGHGWRLYKDIKVPVEIKEHRVYLNKRDELFDKIPLRRTLPFNRLPDYVKKWKIMHDKLKRMRR